MRVAVYSLTRDRLDYTRACFDSLQQRAGIDFDHFILDNGSSDDTVEWLNEYYIKTNKRALVLTSRINLGISKASNVLLQHIKSANDYDLIIKMDNDCYVRSENILGQIVEIYKEALPYQAKLVLSPRVEGIVNQPNRGRYGMLAGRRIGVTAIVGGLFHCVPGEIYQSYRYPETLPLASGQDDHFCNWFKSRGGEVGYIEGLIVEHYEGTSNQAIRYPEYFTRKHIEEKTVPVA